MSLPFGLFERRIFTPVVSDVEASLRPYEPYTITRLERYLVRVSYTSIVLWASCICFLLHRRLVYFFSRLFLFANYITSYISVLDIDLRPDVLQSRAFRIHCWRESSGKCMLVRLDFNSFLIFIDNSFGTNVRFTYRLMIGKAAQLTLLLLIFVLLLLSLLSLIRCVIIICL